MSIVKRTSFFGVKLTLAFFAFVVLPSFPSQGAELTRPLDRRAIVARHKIASDSAELSLPIGNGNLCFNVDGTGMQTFTGDVLSHWGWYSEPLPSKFTWSDVPATGTFAQGRLRSGDPWTRDAALFQWVRNNPHQMNLARVRFVRQEGEALEASEISDVRRELDLWTGVHSTTFQVDGESISVVTCIGDDVNLDSSVGVRVESNLVRAGKLLVEIDLPYPNLAHGAWSGDFSENAVKTPFSVHTPIAVDGWSSLIMKRELQNEYAEGRIGNYSYAARVDVCGGQVAQIGDALKMRIVGTSDASTLDFALTFDGGDYAGRATDDSVFDAAPVKFEDVQASSCARWEQFWQTGGAVDLSESADPRWFELERRVVLSQFQLRSNSAGNWPSSESGLITICPWSGRFHLEMTWWHLAHWSIWDRGELADDALKIYPTVQEGARLLAAQLGYKGFKWQKEIAPDGRTAPWVGNLVLLWKQPHPIFFAELDYRRSPTRETLEKWAEIVEQTAVHMADYATKDEQGVYHLRPAMTPSEQGITYDEVFDLAYWRWGFDAANRWRERLGKERVALWDEVRANMAPLPTKDGVYVHSPEWTDSFEKRNYEHPDLIGVYGMIPPTEGVDRAIEERTLERVVDEWKWERCWGWDFPWMAMCAARVGRPELAVKALLYDAECNQYDVSGVNLGGPSALGGKGPYLPGNGGLLYAIAGMCAGFDENVEQEDGNVNDAMPKSGDVAPGFPEGWKVKWEGLKRPL